MLIRYIKGHFVEAYNVTVGVEFATKTVDVNENTTVKLQIWDTAGQEAFRAIVRSFYKGIAAVFLTYSIDNLESFEALSSWYKEVSDNAHQEVVFFLVGSKADLEDCRKVESNKADNFLKSISGVFYIETSAKTGENIGQLFDKAARIMHKKYRSNGSFRNLVRPVMASGIDILKDDSNSLDGRVSIANQQSKPKKKCC